MPTYEIQAPNGKKYRIEGPAGASDEQVRMKVLEQYPDAGRAAPKVAAKPKGLGQQMLDASTNTLAGVAQGVVGLPDMVTNALGALMGYAVQGGGRVATAVTGDKSYTATADKYARPLQRPATIGGGIEAIAPTPKDGTGRTVRAVSQFAGGLVSPANKLLPSAPTPRPTAPRATSPNALREVVKEGEKRGVRVMTSDVRPPKTIVGKALRGLGEKIPFVGTGGSRAAQADQRVKAVTDFAAEFGADNPGAVEAVAKDFLATRGKALSSLTRQKSAVINRAQGLAPVSKTLDAIDGQIADLTSRATPTSLKAAEVLKSLRPSFEGKTLQQLEAMRQDELGSVFKADTMADIKDVGEKAIRAIYDPLRQDMGYFIKSTQGPEAYRAWRSANAQLSSLAGELKVSGLKRLLRTADATPENVASMLFSAKPSETRMLFNNLSPAGQTKARAALLHRAMEKAGSIGPDGANVVSPERFVNEVSRLGKNIGVTFQGDDAAAVEGFSRLINATRQAGIANVNPTTGAQSVPYLIGGGFASLGPVKGTLAALGAGGLARAYESAPVRNALIGLAKAPSGQQGVAMQRVATALSTFAANNKRALNDNVGVRAAASDGKENQQE